MKSYPCDIPSGLYATCPLHNIKPTSLQAWRDAGQQDFVDFCKARYNELNIGGYFIGTITCPKDNGDCPWSRVGIPIYHALQKALPHPDAAAACVLPCCWRTAADIRAGFSATEWDLQVCEFHQTKDPVRDSYERGEMTVLEYAQAVVEAFKAVCHPTCMTCLRQSTNLPADQVNELLNAAYQESVQVVATDPETYNLDVSFWYVLAKKIK
jgi:hypothetical protein